MAGSCSVGGEENVAFCCICQFPLPVFCQLHGIEHEANREAFHFLLPIEHQRSITLGTYTETKNLLIQINDRCEVFRRKTADVDTWEERVEETYQKILQIASHDCIRYKQKFAAIRIKLREVMESAITETRLHAFDYTYNPPGGELSKLLLSNDSSFISSFQLYHFETNCIKENLGLVFRVALSFAIPGFQDENVGDNPSYLQVQVDMLTKQLKSKEEGHREELSKLRAELEGVKVDKQAAEERLLEVTQQLEKTESQMRKELDEQHELVSSVDPLKKKVAKLSEKLAIVRSALEAMKQEKLVLENQLQSDTKVSTAREAQYLTIVEEKDKLLSARRDLEVRVAEFSKTDEFQQTEIKKLVDKCQKKKERNKALSTKLAVKIEQLCAKDNALKEEILKTSSLEAQLEELAKKDKEISNLKNGLRAIERDKETQVNRLEEEKRKLHLETVELHNKAEKFRNQAYDMKKKNDEYIEKLRYRVTKAELDAMLASVREDAILRKAPRHSQGRRYEPL